MTERKHFEYCVEARLADGRKALGIVLDGKTAFEAAARFLLILRGTCRDGFDTDEVVFVNVTVFADGCEGEFDSFTLADLEPEMERLEASGEEIVRHCATGNPAETALERIAGKRSGALSH